MGHSAMPGPSQTTGMPQMGSLLNGASPRSSQWTESD